MARIIFKMLPRVTILIKDNKVTTRILSIRPLPNIPELTSLFLIILITNTANALMGQITYSLVLLLNNLL